MISSGLDELQSITNTLTIFQVLAEFFKFFKSQHKLQSTVSFECGQQVLAKQHKCNKSTPYFSLYRHVITGVKGTVNTVRDLLIGQSIFPYVNAYQGQPQRLMLELILMTKWKQFYIASKAFVLSNSNTKLPQDNKNKENHQQKRKVCRCKFKENFVR